MKNSTYSEVKENAHVCHYWYNSIVSDFLERRSLPIKGIEKETVIDPRIAINGTYRQVLEDRGLRIGAIEDKTVTDVAEVTQRVKTYIAQQEEQGGMEKDGHIFQSETVLAIYLGQVYELLQRTSSQSEAVEGLRKTFSSFEDFVQEHLKDLAPRYRAILRRQIGRYVISQIYEPEGTGQGQFRKTKGFWHSSGSSVLDNFLQEGLLSPREAIKRGKMIKTGEYVSGDHTFRNDAFEESLVNNTPVNSQSLENGVYVNRDNALNPRTILSDHYAGNAVTWFDHYPVDFFINGERLMVSGAEFVPSPGATSTSELCIRENVPPITVTDIFVPFNKMNDSKVRQLVNGGITVHAREDYDLHATNTLYVADDYQDAFLTPQQEK